MAKFKDAITFVLDNEGGFVDDPNDPGGSTNYGISCKFLNKYCDKELLTDIFGHNKNITPDEIKSLSRDNAIKIYEKCFWQKYPYEKINDQELATRVFDFTIHKNPYESHRILQSAFNKLLPDNSAFKIKIDGIIGPKTLKSINYKDSKMILGRFKSLRADFYRILCLKNENLRQYLKGWLNRANK